MDPFPGPAPVPEDRVKKFRRKDKIEKVITLVLILIFLSFDFSTKIKLLNKLLISNCKYMLFVFVFSLQPDCKRYKLNQMINRSEEASEVAQTQAARFDLLLPEEAG